MVGLSKRRKGGFTVIKLKSFRGKCHEGENPGKEVVTYVSLICIYEQVEGMAGKQRGDDVDKARGVGMC